MNRLSTQSGITGLLLLAISQIASATVITSTLTTDFSGTTDATGSVLITFDDLGGTGLVRTTIDLNNLGPATTAFVDEAWLNFTGDATTLSFGNFTVGTGDTVTVPTITTCNQGTACTNTFRPDGDGFFDINLAFAQSGTGRLQAGELIRFDITLPGITANDFNTTSLLASGNRSTHCTAVHAQGLTNGNSDFLGAGCVVQQLEPPNRVPESGILSLLAVGLLGLGVKLKK